MNQAVPQAEDDIDSGEAQFGADENDSGNSDEDTDLPASNLKQRGNGSPVVDIPLTKDQVNTLETLYEKMEEGSEDAAEHLVRSVELRKLGEQYQLRALTHWRNRQALLNSGSSIKTMLTY